MEQLSKLNAFSHFNILKEPLLNLQSSLDFIVIEMTETKTLGIMSRVLQKRAFQTMNGFDVSNSCILGKECNLILWKLQMLPAE